MQKELQNYRRYSVEEMLPQEIRPTLRFTAAQGDYALIIYSWAGGWDRVRSFRDFFMEAGADTLVRVTKTSRR